jgi:hypothetical protein
MTLDTSDLRGAIAALEEQVARLRRIADAADPRPGQIRDLSSLGLRLPAEVAVTRSGEIAGYLREHPDLIGLASEMARATAKEFRGERSHIELTLYQDPEIDDTYLAIYVRVPDYSQDLMSRLREVSRPFNERRARASGWILITTDHGRIE